MAKMYIIDMEVRNGETFRQSFRLLKKNGQPVDLTDKTAKAQVRPEPGSATLIAEMDCEIDTSAGRIIIEIPASVTAEITPGKYVYDVCTCYDTNSVRTVKYYVGGKFLVLPSATDALE